MPSRRTPDAFLQACATGDLATMRQFIARGTDVNMPEWKDMKPLALALDNNQLAAMNLLLQNKADPNALYISEPMLHHAFFKANRKAVDMLLEAGAAPTALEKGIYSIVDFATRGGDEVLVQKAIRLLFSAGFDMQNVYDEALNAAVVAGDVYLAEFFIQRGAHPDSAGHNFCFGYPPLVKAALSNDEKMVVMLARYGATAGIHLPEVQALLKQRGDADE